MKRTLWLIGCSIMIVGAILIPLSQMPENVTVYQLTRTVDFIQGQFMELNWTFVKGEYYQFEVVGVSWTGYRTLILYSDTGIIGRPINGPPWVCKVPREGKWEESNSTFDPHDPWDMTRTKMVVFDSETVGGVALEAEQGTHVNVYKAVETSLKLYDYLLYVGASVAIIGAVIAAIGVISSPRTGEKGGNAV